MYLKKTGKYQVNADYIIIIKTYFTPIVSYIRNHEMQDGNAPSQIPGCKHPSLAS